MVEIYVVPTGSMEDTILTGDMLIGNKFIYGMRTPIWFGVPYTRFGFNIPWFRLPAFKDVENGDVTIFEFPRDPFQKYVKRCIGTPGDSIYLHLGKIIINSDVVKNKTPPILLFSSNRGTNRLLVNKSWILFIFHILEEQLEGPSIKWFSIPICHKEKNSPIISIISTNK